MSEFPFPPEPFIHRGDALDLLMEFPAPIDLLATDPPYAFGGSGGEHALSATVAVVLRETALRMSRGAWAVVFAASSWRSTAYMVEAVRGILDPVRIGTWLKPEARTKVAGGGWKWASVNVIVFRKGKGRPLEASDELDHIIAAPVKNGRRAELPAEVADWAVSPFALAGGICLDPFAGSGALVAAAGRAGMDAHGFEREQKSGSGTADRGGSASLKLTPTCVSEGRGSSLERLDGLGDEVVEAA